MVTLIIFTYKRHDYLKRSIAYYKQHQLDVIVVDASDEFFEGEVPSNIKYIHCPAMSLANRLREAYGLVKTKYILLSPDDDFFTKSGIRAAEEFLEKNPDYSSAQGLYTRFYLSGERIIWNWDYEYSIGMNIGDNDPVLRFQRGLMSPIMHYCYSVMRIECFAKTLDILENVPKAEFSIAYEMSFIPSLLLHGKHKIISVFFCARQLQIADHGNVSSALDWVSGDELNNYKKFEFHVAKLLSSSTNLHFAIAKDLVNKSFLNYALESEKKRKYKNAKSNNIIQIIISIMPKLKNVIKPYYYDLIGCVKYFINTNYSLREIMIMFDELAKINLLVNAYEVDVSKKRNS